MRNPIIKTATVPILLILASLTHAQITTAPASSSSFSSPSSSSTASNDLLSSDEVHKLVDAGQYKDALRALARILNLTGSAVGSYDRLDLLPLKAECQLQNHDTIGALQTLAVARKEAVEAKKPDNILLIDGFVELIQKSPSNLYLPKTGSDKTPIKLLDRSVRKSAYDALFADLFAVFEQKANFAITGKTLQPYMDAAKAVTAVRPAEFCSTGSNKKTETLIKTLAEHVIKLVTSAIADLNARHTRIKTAANQLLTEEVNVTIGNSTVMEQQTHRRGLSLPQDPNTLQDIINTCTKLKEAITELSTAFAVDEDAFKEQITKAEKLKEDATDTLNDNYISEVPPPNTQRPNNR